MPTLVDRKHKRPPPWAGPPNGDSQALPPGLSQENSQGSPGNSENAPGHSGFGLGHGNGPKQRGRNEKNPEKGSKSSVSPDASSDNGSFKPIWYVYDQFSFDPLTEFQFPNKEVHYRRSFNHPYSKEIFSGDTPEDSDELQQLGRYGYFYFNHRNDVTSVLKHNGNSLQI